MKRALITSALCILSLGIGWFAYDLTEGPDLVPPVLTKIANPPSIDQVEEKPEMEVMAAGGWVERVTALENQVAVLTERVAFGDEYIEGVNAALQRYVFFVYGTFSEDPAENLDKLEKWVLDIREEMKQTKARITALENQIPDTSDVGAPPQP
jgi:hypothetical protein